MNKMKNKFSLFKSLETNLNTIECIDNSIKIVLGPTGKTGLSMNTKNNLKFLTSGSSLMKSLEFQNKSSNVILKLIEQASNKSFKVSGDGCTTTVLILCQLLKTSLRFLINDYNSIFIGNGIRKISYFLNNKVIEYAQPITNNDQLFGILKTNLGEKIDKPLFNILKKTIPEIKRDGLILIEENNKEKNELEIVQGIEIDKGFSSSYFVNDIKNFEVNYENPLILIANKPLNSVNQLRDIIDYVKQNNRPLVIIGENIKKDVISTLVLNNIQKKIKVVVIKTPAINFIKTGALEDLATLTFSGYYESNLKEENYIYNIKELGQSEKVIVKAEKTIFIISKFSKLIATRKINELNRLLLNCETEYEKDIFKTRIARLSGNIIKIKIGLTNKYNMAEQQQKVESAITTLKSALEEGILPGGGSFFLFLREELRAWGNLNLIGDELFAIQIVSEALIRPFNELFNNINKQNFFIKEELSKRGYPFGYNLIDNKIVNTLENGLIDSAKTIRAILWNSLTTVLTLITTE